MFKFNLIEVIIALLIALVILTGIIGLMPKGISVNTDAISRSNGSDAADQFLHLMATRIEQNWNERLAFPEIKPEIADDRILIFSQNLLFNGEGLKILFEAPNELDQWDPKICNKGFFKISHVTWSTSATDFSGVIRAWREVGIAPPIDSTGPQPESIRICIEVSWPFEMPYEKRTKENYELEVFRSDYAWTSIFTPHSDECRTQGSMVGNIELNPNNSGWAEFYMILADGTRIDRDFLLANPNFEYNGVITYTCFRAKGNSSDLTIGGSNYDINNTTYVISGIRVVVHLYNSGNNGGTNMGQWILEVIASTPDAYIDQCVTCGQRRGTGDN